MTFEEVIRYLGIRNEYTLIFIDEDINFTAQNYITSQFYNHVFVKEGFIL